MSKIDKIYSMKETCEATGLTYDTLKFYCNEGLIPNVKRDKNNYRIFDDDDISWNELPRGRATRYLCMPYSNSFNCP